MPEKTSETTHQRVWRWKRIIVVALLLLIGGAVVNVAVAYACFFFVKYDLYAASDIRVEPGDWIHTASPFADWGASVTRQRAFGKRVDRYISFGSTVEATDVAWVLAERTVIGLPLKAIEGAEVLKPIEGAETSREPDRTLVLQGAIPIHGRHGRMVPIQPRYAGFIINTLFYALLLWLLFLAPFATRRALRRKRRLCEKCAYPVGVGAVCTECGAALPLMKK